MREDPRVTAAQEKLPEKGPKWLRAIAKTISGARSAIARANSHKDPAPVFENGESEINAATILKDPNLYGRLSGFTFPVLRKAGTQAKYMEKDLTRKIYTHPTEPYEEKKAFLKRNDIDKARAVATILGANWPIFYADLAEGKSSVIAIDQNKQQIELLDAFVRDEKKFLKQLQQNPQGAGRKNQLPYIPPTKMVKRFGQVRKAVFDQGDPKYQTFERLRDDVGRMAREGRLSALNCNLQDLSHDADWEGIDYIDLSNVPEIIGIEETNEFIRSLPPGIKIYISFITESMQPFIAKLENCRIIDRDDGKQEGTGLTPQMVLLEKTA